MRHWLEKHGRSQTNYQNENEQQHQPIFPIAQRRSLAQAIVGLGLATALAVTAVAIIGKRSASLVLPLPEHTRGTSDLWQGTPMQAIMIRWPREEMPAWAADMFDPAPGPPRLPVTRNVPPATQTPIDQPEPV